MAELACVIAAIAAGLMWWSYAGPFRWIAEAQLSMFGSHSAQLTWILTVAAVALPAKYLLTRMAIEGPTVVWHPYGAWLLVAGLGFLLVGLYLSAVSASMEHHRVTTADLEMGKGPTSQWLSVEGAVAQERAVCIGSAPTECYLPLVSKDWTLAVPIGAFLRTLLWPGACAGSG